MLEYILIGGTLVSISVITATVIEAIKNVDEFRKEFTGY